MQSFGKIWWVPLVCGTLLAAPFWEEKPYTQWSSKECLKLLQDSPWADVQTNTLFNPSGSGLTSPGIGPSGLPTTPRTGEERVGDYAASEQFFIRFQSAKPVRMALAQLQLLQGRVSEEEAQAFVAADPVPGKIVVVIGTAPGQDRTIFDVLTTEEARNHTYLVGRKSKEKIYVEQYISPAQGGGIEATLIFPRFDAQGKELFPLSEKEIRLVSRIGGGINRSFKLEKMVFQGKLEI